LDIGQLNRQLKNA